VRGVRARAGTPHDRPPGNRRARAQRRALTPEAWRDLSASDDETSIPVATNGAGLCADSHCPLVCLLLRRRTGIGPTRRCIPVLLRELGSLLFAVPQRALLHDLS
jgi:hypothetical protein